jgi:hypothetical protein
VLPGQAPDSYPTGQIPTHSESVGQDAPSNSEYGVIPSGLHTEPGFPGAVELKTDPSPSAATHNDSEGHEIEISGGWHGGEP